MPEHETHDYQGALDEAFARLEQDITTLSTAPGAGAAVARARRRRRTRAGAVAVVAVLAVAGVAVAQGVRHDTAVEPSSALPTPAPLDAAALTAATDSWTSAWAAASAEESQLLTAGPVEHCLARTPALTEAADGPVRGSGNLFFAAGKASALATLVDLGGTSAEADQLWASLTTALARCGTATPAEHLVWDGAEGHSYDLVSATGEPEHFWVAQEGSAIGLMWVSGAPPDVPSAVDDGVILAMVAALRFPASYHDEPNTTSGASVSASETSASLSSSDFAAALGGWQSGWSATGGEREVSTLPCGVNMSSASSGHGSSLGANGDQETYGFETEGAAQQALHSAADEFAACPSTSYDVHTVRTTDGRTVTVVAGTGPDADVVWLVQSGTGIASVAIPAGDTTPPDSVTRAVGELLPVDLRADEGAPVSTSSQSAGSSGGPVERGATSPDASSSTAP
jgi:hypothetical protein